MASPKVADKAYVNSPPPSRSWSFHSSEEDDITGANSSSSMEDNDQDELNTVEVVFNKIYLDPLQEVMESIDSEAAGILRTGKLTIHGEAGGTLCTMSRVFCMTASNEHSMKSYLLYLSF